MCLIFLLMYESYNNILSSSRSWFIRFSSNSLLCKFKIKFATTCVRDFRPEVDWVFHGSIIIRDEQSGPGTGTKFLFLTGTGTSTKMFFWLGPASKFFLNRTGIEMFFLGRNRHQNIFDWDRHQNLFLKGPGPRPKTSFRRDRDQKWLVPLMSNYYSIQTSYLSEQFRTDIRIQSWNPTGRDRIFAMTNFCLYWRIVSSINDFIHCF